jgi:hypothetical protein
MHSYLARTVPVHGTKMVRTHMVRIQDKWGYWVRIRHELSWYENGTNTYGTNTGRRQIRSYLLRAMHQLVRTGHDFHGTNVVRIPSQIMHSYLARTVPVHGTNRVRIYMVRLRNESTYSYLVRTMPPCFE